MPANERMCHTCRSAISRSDFRYRVSEPGQPNRSLCSACVTRYGVRQYRKAVIVLPDDLSAMQQSLFCSCSNCRIADAPLEIAEREATALAQRMLIEIPLRHDAGDTTGARIRADTLAVLAKSKVKLDLRGADREIAYAAKPYQALQNARDQTNDSE